MCVMLQAGEYYIAVHLAAPKCCLALPDTAENGYPARDY
jgi:hypothetical protein